METVERRTPDGMLVVRADVLDDVLGSGLDRLATWTAWLREPAGRPGRGASAVQSLKSGLRIHVKQLRRGGALAGLWHDRFAGSGRIVRNVTVPLAAADKGVSTPMPVAALAVPGPRGFCRGWLAIEEIPGAIDLHSRLERKPPPGDAAMRGVLCAVRVAHDAGLVHPDLNLGNLMIRETTGEEGTWIIDLDGARLWPDPLPLRRRIAELRRMERSYKKWFGDDGPLGRDVRTTWLRWYAGENPHLASALGV